MNAVLPSPKRVRPHSPATPSAVLRPLAGRTAVVTGSTRGIGEGIARALAEAGCNLVLNGRGPSREGKRLVDEIGETWSIDAAYCPADLRRTNQVDRLAGFALDRFGRVDILINNAGIQHVAPVEAFADE